MQTAPLPFLDGAAAARDFWRAEEVLTSHVCALRALEVPLGRMLAFWIRAGKHFSDLVTSTAEFGHFYGLGPSEIHRLIALGFLLEEHPEVEAPFREGRLSLENASLLHDVYSVKSAVREGEDWLAMAIATPTADFRRKIDKRLAEVGSGPTSPWPGR